MESGGGDDAVEYVVRDSHRTLLVALKDATEGLPIRPELPGHGLVMVPVSRSSPVLTCAVAAAERLGWPLLLICSREAKAPAMRELVWDGGAEVALVAADLLHTESLRASREWRTFTHPAAKRRAHIDTNRKRNLALAAARLTARDFVLFVDDDVVGLTPDHVVQALEVLAASAKHHIVSWPLAEFPDNSVVHHARRDVLGRPQETFVGGGALLVRTEMVPLDDAGGVWVPPGFPPMYNEDWLFLFAPIMAGAVLMGPDVGQAELNPYEDPGRAAREEFGDVLGEGLYHLLHAALPIEVARHGHYWHSVHRKRGKLLARLIEEARARADRVDAPAQEVLFHRQVIEAISAARMEHSRATPEALADFVRRWCHDEETWRQLWRSLPAEPRRTVKAALLRVGLQDSWVVTADV